MCAHWHIANRLHSVRDVTFCEDCSRLRTGHARQVLAALRNLALTLIHHTGFWAIAVTRRTFATYPEHAFALLLPSPSEYSQALIWRVRAICHAEYDVIAGVVA